MRWISVFEDVFWLGKPKFHNRRMNSAARISIKNLPERQNPHAATRKDSCAKNFKSTSFLVNTSIHSTTAKLIKYTPSGL